jgi:hypothetical protein
MSTKERSKSHLNEEKSKSILKQKFPLECVFREYTPDYGIDFSIELFTEINSKQFTQGEHLYIQLKSVETPKISKLKVYPRHNVEKKRSKTRH